MTPTPQEPPAARPEKELTAPVNLCDARGRLNPAAVGWSRRPLHTCNLSGHWPRKKRWNYWCVTTPNFLFSITLSNIDYMGLAFAYFLDFETKRFIEQTVMLPFGQGCRLPETVEADVIFEHQAMQLSFREVADGVHIRVASSDFGHTTLAADLHIARPQQHETLNVVVPWDSDHFQFTSKQNCLPTHGEVRVGSDTFAVGPADGFACLDYGRGVWPYRCFWNWAAFSSSAIGANLGAGWTDRTGSTENGLTVRGRLHKLSEDVIFSYDPSHFMQPWALKTRETGRVDLVFTPFFERVAKTDFGVLRSEAHQMIGRFSGTVVADDGQQIKVDNLVGWAEEHRARW